MKKVAVICVLVFCTVMYCMSASVLFPTASAQQSSGDGSLLLNGTSAYFSVPNSLSLDITGAITVEAWIKRNANGTHAIVERYSCSGGGYALRVQNDKLQFMTLRNNYEYDLVVGNSTVMTGTWLHVAGVFDGTQLRVYLNGTLDGSKNSVFAPGSGTSNLRIGVAGDGDTDFFNGLIDEVRITPEGLYSTNFNPPVRLMASGRRESAEGVTKGFWNFDDQSSNDGSGFNNHGSLIGGAWFSTDTAVVNPPSPIQPAGESDELPPVTINFDNVPAGTFITNQYPYTLFSAVNNYLPVASNGSSSLYGQSNPNFLSTNYAFANFPIGLDNFGERTIEFTQPVNKLVFYVIGLDDAYNPNRPLYKIDVYKNGQFSGTLNGYGCGRCGGYWDGFADGITKVRIHSIVDSAGLGIDNVSFSPARQCKTPDGQPIECSQVGSYSPEGVLDGVDFNGIATGYAFDRDTTSTPIEVRFYIDGTTADKLVGSTVAGLSRAGLNVPGNHGFSFQIPERFKDGRPHTLYAQGIDKTNNANTILPTPKSFTIGEVQSVIFEQIDGLPLGANPTPAGGQRFFPDRFNVTDSPNNTAVRVKAVAPPNATVYFKAFDLDDPTPVFEIVEEIAGNDNRTLNATDPFEGTLNASSALANANGVAAVTLTTNRFPGNNYMVAASLDQNYLSRLDVKGLALIDRNTQGSPTKAKTTQMLTIWRRLHIEVDSMGYVSGNYVTGRVTAKSDAYKLYSQTYNGTFTNIYVDTLLERNRFQNGKLEVYAIPDGESFVVGRNSETNYLQILGTAYPDIVGAPFIVYDDDDFNGNDGANLDGDGGEVLAASRTDIIFSRNLLLMQASDDPAKNVYAAAFIRPVYDGGGNTANDTTNLPFYVNNEENQQGVDDPINNARNSEGNEADDFWVVYLQIAYQGARLKDNDPSSESATFGVTPSPGSADFFVTRPCEVPQGGFGALVYLEIQKDGTMEHPTRGAEFNEGTAPHEVGHQFGLRGDRSGFGIMGNNEQLIFTDPHLQILRLRVRSPGQTPPPCS